MKTSMNFREWLILAEMASFSVPPQEKAAVPCGMIRVPGLPCKDGIIGAIDMRFEGPPPYDPPFNRFGNFSKFIAKLPGHGVPAQYLVYHGGHPPAQVMFEEKAKATGYPQVPDYWFERAELMDTDYNLIKPALGDHSGEREAAGVGATKAQI
jgi:hypothetical protein